MIRHSTTKANGRHKTLRHHLANGHAFHEASLHLKGAGKGLEKEIEKYVKGYSATLTKHVKGAPIRSVMISTLVGIAVGAIFLR